ncbi:hypothetical protein C477_12747 [Haloterrigena salina JCM 13891]|uniref:DUF7344 domain-containing protein n=1 Tax=Haloterrigena salina JCM 13891 TaxID=1227488 RepID=M0C474_9EURY|nr:hypothetical protein C477_12747 [Haloterrigena salina JCM 13891]
MPDDSSENEFFQVLQNQRRRTVLESLMNKEDGKMTVGELAEKVAVEENNLSSPNKLSTDQRKRVYVALYQTHLVRLEEVGLVRYDKDRGIVELTAEQNKSISLSKIPRLLNLDPSKYYMVVSIFMLSVLLAIEVGLLNLNLFILAASYALIVVLITIGKEVQEKY